MKKCFATVLNEDHKFFGIRTDFGMTLTLDFRPTAALVGHLCPRCNPDTVRVTEGYTFNAARCHCARQALGTRASVLLNSEELLDVLDGWVREYEGVDPLEAVLIASMLMEDLRHKAQIHRQARAREAQRARRAFRKAKRKQGYSARDISTMWTMEERLRGRA